MDQDALESVGPEQLARLLDVGGAKRVWSEADGAAALRHQLGATLMPDLGNVAGAEEERLAALAGKAREAGVVTLLEALVSPGTPLELLEGIKVFGRQVQKDVASPLCGAGGTVIYYAAIAAGLEQGARISKLSSRELREGFVWASKQAGAEGLGVIFEKAIHKSIDL